MSQITPKLTPMYEQYLQIKEEYPDTILFYRMGDFYEVFFQDAEIAARELQLTLTSRSRDEGGIPMCGVPWHAAEVYFSQMVEKGYKIAVCDQMEDPKLAKGLVKRGVSRVITPGTALDELNLEAKAHTYLGAFLWQDEQGAFAWMDVSTGEWTGFQSGRQSELWQWIYKIAPRELLVPQGTEVPELVRLQQQTKVVFLAGQSHFDRKRSAARVLEAQKVAELASLGLEKKPVLTCACGALVAYLEQTQKASPAYLSPFRPLNLSSHMIVDEVTERNLELFRRYDGRKGSGTLWHELDMTQTPMGGRLLEERLRYPWKDVLPITENQDVVAYFYERPELRDIVRAALDKVYDLERLSTRVSLNRCLPRDFVSLRDSLKNIPDLLDILKKTVDLPTEAEARGDYLPAALGRLVRQWDNLDDIAQLLEKSIADDPPAQITDGMLFKYGYNAQLDELLDLVEHGEAKLQELLLAEQQRSNLPKLRLGYNRVFGYYFELSKSQQGAQLPEYFQRRQTLTNSERFITPELKEMEDKLLSASDSRKSLEYKLFQQLRERIADERPRLLFMADLLAHVDFWQGLGHVAAQKGWVRPVVDDGSEIRIREGRHPVVEAFLGKSAFIPNDLMIDGSRRLLIITGPNMAGKSTVLRQTAILCILAQMGSFVPASEAHIGLVDRVFSRVGASDNLAQGQSTFMVEMMETARILRQSTKRSLVILDEIGRGTSTFDGLAIAWAVVEELIKRAAGGIRTLFATHYHELTVLDGKIPGVFNMNIAIREWNNDIVFLRKLIPGPADKSYGIEVARLAGVPMPVVQRAREILSNLENNREQAEDRIERAFLPGLSVKTEAPAPKAEPIPVLEALKALNPDTLTPLEALKTLSEWKVRWGKK